MYKLVIADEGGSTSTVPVIRDEITIGRQEGNTIRLTERDVSRRHARVMRQDDRIFVEDVAARYGIKKNGVKIKQRAEFAPGDVVSIGGYQLTLKAKKPQKTPAAPPIPKKKPSTKDLARDEGTQILPAMPAKLVVISSNFAGQEFPLNRKEIIIGRGEDCDIIIDHRSVSQRHAKVIREMGNKYQIVDLNSKNGISIAGEQYRAVQVKRGDVVELGHVKFRFVEPGENYVFTPHQSVNEFDFDAESQSGSSSSKMLPLALLLIALLVGGGVLYLVLSGDKKSADPVNTSVTQADNAPSTNGAKAAIDPSANANAKPSNKVDRAIKEARENIRAGQLNKALGALTSAKKFLDPTTPQQNQIAELIGKAKNEKPFKKDYQAAKNYLKSEDYKASLARLGKIPEHSIFHQLSLNEGLMGQAIDGMVADAEDLLANNDRDGARKMAKEALFYDAEHPGALALIASLDAQKAKLAARAAKRAETHHQTHSRPDPAPKEEVSAEEAKKLATSAQGKIFNNDPGGAVKDCKKALQGGYSGCYRIMAIAYKKMGNPDSACKNFKRYLGTSPGNASRVQRQMEQLGCK